MGDTIEEIEKRLLSVMEQPGWTDYIEKNFPGWPAEKVKELYRKGFWNGFYLGLLYPEAHMAEVRRQIYSKDCK